MDELARRVLKVFIEMGSESLDLHTLFEAGGNDPASRKRVLDVVTRLVDTGHLESRGSDFYFAYRKGQKSRRLSHRRHDFHRGSEPGKLSVASRASKGRA